MKESGHLPQGFKKTLGIALLLISVGLMSILGLFA